MIFFGIRPNRRQYEDNYLFPEAGEYEENIRVTSSSCYEKERNVSRRREGN